MVAESIKIINGFVLDGAGNAATRKDILISGDSIKAVSNSIKEKGDLVIDASGLHVAPGFIDIHSHSDLNILGNLYSPEKILQGVTTEVVGNCGVSLAPTTATSFDYGRMAAVMLAGIHMDSFPDFEAFFRRLSEAGHSINIAALVPHGNIHVAVMDVSTEPASPDKLDEMKAMLAKNMAAGAFGMSTGLIYPPGSDTGTPELVELAKVLRDFGGFYASHIRNEAKGVIRAVREAIHIGKEAGVPVEISHLKVAFAKGLTSKLLKTIKQARTSEMDVTADVYPYTAGSTNLGAVVLPSWILAKDGEEITRTLMDPAMRKRVYEEAILNMLKFVRVSPKLLHIIPKPLIAFVIGLLAKRIIVTKGGKSANLAGRKLDDIFKNDPDFAAEKGIINKFIAMLGREQGNLMMCMFQEDEKQTLIPIMKAPFVMIGTDSTPGHPRTWGCYPRLIGTYVRDRKIFTLEEAIYKCTGMVANRLGLNDRGSIKPGCKADIMTFDLATIKDNSTYENWNAPPVGIKHVFVNGKLTAQDGVHLKVKNGLILKPQRERK
nr:D-aminoacylase [Candidatus Sigynarchaeota archaeon]